MATHAGVGRSDRAVAREAGREAAQAALTAAGGVAPGLCLVFGTSGYDQHELLAGVRECAGAALLAGCSGEGIIAGSRSEESERAVVVLVVASDALRFDATMIDSYGSASAQAGRSLAAWASERGLDDALALFVFPDGLSGDCSAMLEALHEGLPAGLPVVGGAAGDALLLQQTWQYSRDRVASGAISAVLLHGKGAFEVSLSHGCNGIGLPRQVTEAEGSWLRTIDGRAAWAVLREYLDGEPENLDGEGVSHVSFAEELDASLPDDYGRFVVRTPLGLDGASGSLFLPGGGLATGTRIRLVRRDPELIRYSARSCAERIAGRHGGRKPAFVLQFDCAGRGRSLFGSCVAEEIVHPLQQALGTDVPWAGFHTYGEIGPVGGRARYHNYTVALCAFYDEPDAGAEGERG